VELPLARLDCTTYVQGVRAEGGLRSHGGPVHDGIVLGLGRHLQELLLRQRQPDAVAQHGCIGVAGHDRTRWGAGSYGGDLGIFGSAASGSR